LAKEGFRRNSQNFVIETSESWGIINFQKSLHSSANEKRFTVNLAIAAKRILRFGGETDQKPPLYYACHWRIRIGNLVPGRGDRWWTLTDEASYKTALPEVEELIKGKAVPLVTNHLSMRDCLRFGTRMWVVSGVPC